MANWYWIYPASEAAQYSNSASKPPGTISYSTTAGSAQDNALHTGGTVTLGGKPYSRWIGPFPSAAALNKTTTANNSTLAGIAAGVQEGNTLAGGFGLPSISNPLSGIQGMYKAIQDFLSFLGNRQSWVRIAEVVIGVGLVIVAVDELAKGTPAGDVAHKAAKAAFLA